ncbi:hypothetical protein EV421DRAFT_1909169 [Armillaria borealis]|uniref:Uncharacterized protein n=1 Tax=Armillaria borealis TaxID=47425 RepID=A0AA39MI92_9AGAR|nr:hypothetical protein EV421DRAFT_1909169 [Armillaria borealis]
MPDLTIPQAFTGLACGPVNAVAYLYDCEPRSPSEILQFMDISEIEPAHPHFPNLRENFIQELETFLMADILRSKALLYVLTGNKTIPRWDSNFVLKFEFMPLNSPGSIVVHSCLNSASISWDSTTEQIVAGNHPVLAPGMWLETMFTGEAGPNSVSNSENAARSSSGSDLSSLISVSVHNDASSMPPVSTITLVPTVLSLMPAFKPCTLTLLTSSFTDSDCDVVDADNQTTCPNANDSNLTKEALVDARIQTSRPNTNNTCINEANRSDIACPVVVHIENASPSVPFWELFIFHDDRHVVKHTVIFHGIERRGTRSSYELNADHVEQPFWAALCHLAHLHRRNANPSQFCTSETTLTSPRAKMFNL